MNTINQIIDIKSVRELARVYDTEQLTLCIDEQIAGQTNGCEISGDNTQVINALSRASVIRQLMDKGASLPEATRELGRRMRRFIELNR